MTIQRNKAYETWRACAQAIHSVVPDMAVSLLDTGEVPVLPPWLSKLPGGASALLIAAWSTTICIRLLDLRGPPTGLVTGLPIL